MNNKNTSNLLSNTKNNNYVILKLNDKQFAVSVEEVLEIMSLPEIVFMEKSPYGIVGMLKYDEQLVNIIDVKVLFNMKVESFSTNNKLIILRHKEKIFSIISDSITDITRIPEDKIQDIPFDSSFNIATKIIKDFSGIVYVIDTEKMLSLLEQNSDKISDIDYKLLYPNDEKSAKIVEIRTKKQKVSSQEFNFPVCVSSLKQYVLLTLGNQNYYLDLKYVKEFVSLKRLNITPLPYTEDFVKGIVNIKGDYLVVIDLKRFLRNDRNEIKNNFKLVIVRGKNFDIALMVDDVKYIKALDKIDHINQEIMHNSEYILSEFTENNQLYSILNFEKIINDEKLYVNIT